MKTMTKLAVVAILGVALFSLSPAFGQTKQPQSLVAPRLEAAMDDTDLMYRVDEDGDVQLEIAWDDNRSQLVIVNSATETYDDMEVREVWTRVAIYEDFDSIPKKDLLALLEASEQLKMGRYTAITADDGSVMIFLAVVVDANMSGEDLASVIDIVAVQGDEMEKDLMDGSDDF